MALLVYCLLYQKTVGMGCNKYLTPAESLYLNRLWLSSFLSETMFGEWGLILRESNHGPRVYRDRTAKILRMRAGSLVRRCLGPMRTRVPSPTSTVKALFGW